MRIPPSRRALPALAPCAALAAAPLARAQAQWRVTDLGDLGAGFSTATGLNAAGQVTGGSRVPELLNFHAFLWDAGRMSDLGTLGGDGSSAYAIDDAGLIAGASRAAGAAWSDAVLWRAGAIEDLGTLEDHGVKLDSAAIAINACGQVLGRSGAGAGLTLFLHSGGAMIDLLPLLTGFTGIASESAFLNDAGQIAGSGYNLAGEVHAFLLTPVAAVPEAPPLAMLASGIAVLAGALRRRTRPPGAAAPIFPRKRRNPCEPPS